MGGISVCLCLHKPRCFPSRFSCFQFPCCCILAPPCGLLEVWPIPCCLMKLEMVVLCVLALVGGLKYYASWVTGLDDSYLHLVTPSVCLIWVWICKPACCVWLCGTTGTKMMFWCNIWQYVPWYHNCCKFCWCGSPRYAYSFDCSC